LYYGNTFSRGCQEHFNNPYGLCRAQVKKDDVKRRIRHAFLKRHPTVKGLLLTARALFLEKRERKRFSKP
jgi:hypothetical protein